MAPRLSGLDGVFVGSHAIAQGALTRRQLRESGYRRVVQGVYAVPQLPVDHALHCRAVSLLLPPSAVIGGRSAACWYGAPWAAAGDPVTVVVPRDHKWSGPRGVRVHRTDLAVHERVEIDGVPLTTALRAAWDVAALESLPTAVGTLDGMVRSGAVALSDLEGMARAGSGRWRVTRVRKAVDLVDARSESPPESWVRVALGLANLPPCVPQYQVRSGGQFLARVDFAWPELKLAVEYEGAHHFEGTQIVKDDERLARLVAAGWLVIRLSAADLRDLTLVVERVRQAIASRATH
jgi:uncharacterized protein DUF559